MVDNNELINKRIASIKQKLRMVTNPVPLCDNFVLQCFVGEL
jgi:uncharacterized protein YfkK (UPF0435 family)